MKNQAYDLIGDIHGQHEKLVTLLNALGYELRGECRGWSHPEGRKVIFLGDYIDRGPKVREVLREVRDMVEAGDALAILGNHEFAAILHAAEGGSGARPSADLAGTLTQFAGREDEWEEMLSWMRGLPLFLDLGGVRAVHACWDEKAVAALDGFASLSPDLLCACRERNAPERRAVERLLNGPQLPVPDDALVLNSRGMPLPSVRVRWWRLPAERCPVGDLALPESLGGRGWFEPGHLAGLPDYPADAPPVFFGHYWMPPERVKASLAPNVACLDYSAGRGDAPLVAYRWEGEEILSDEKFFVSP